MNWKIASSLLLLLAGPLAGGDSDWPSYGRDAGGGRYSPLSQVNRENVSKLRVAWTHHVQDVSDGKATNGNRSAFEATPILVDGTLYVSTPFSRVLALDPETGAEKWSFDPKIDLTLGYGDGLVSRGVSTWLDPERREGEACRRRIFLGSLDARLYALDAATGKPCSDFGSAGRVDLTRGVANYRPGVYHLTSPPAVIGSLVVVGSSINDNMRVDMPRGIVRAFDTRTGKLAWSFDPIPTDPSDPAFKTWAAGGANKSGAANVWSIISADPERGLVFLPVGAASTDYFGGERKGSDLYANSVVAIRASDGRVVWHFQVVHHDLWDYDVAAEPALVTVRREGREIAAVAVATKMGNLFLLDRETGHPIYPVEERPVPQGGVPGEELWPTQPFPTLPPPLSPQGKITPEDAWALTPEGLESCRQRIAAARSDGIFTPPSVGGSIIFPGNIGGMHWGGVSFDPERRLLVTNTNRLAALITLIPREGFDEEKRRTWSQKDPTADLDSQTGTPYFLSRGYLIAPPIIPCTAPPWGTLAAVRVDTGEIAWQVPLGVMPEIAEAPGAENWGSLNFGGSIVTAGGLVFIGASRDSFLRAFDTETGKELWKGEIPAPGNATPMTYSYKGRQYVVIAAGGHGKLRTNLSDTLVAFALPGETPAK